MSAIIFVSANADTLADRQLLTFENVAQFFNSADIPSLSDITSTKPSMTGPCFTQSNGSIVQSTGSLSLQPTNPVSTTAFSASYLAAPASRRPHPKPQWETYQLDTSLLLGSTVFNSVEPIFSGLDREKYTGQPLDVTTRVFYIREGHGVAGDPNTYWIMQEMDGVMGLNGGGAPSTGTTVCQFTYTP